MAYRDSDAQRHKLFTNRNGLTIVLAPSSQRNPLSELVRIFPPARSSASNTVTRTPLFLSLYAATSPLHGPSRTRHHSVKHLTCTSAKPPPEIGAKSCGSPDTSADDGDRPGAGVVGGGHGAHGAESAPARGGGATRAGRGGEACGSVGRGGGGGGGGGSEHLIRGLDGERWPLVAFLRRCRRSEPRSSR